MAQLGKDKGTSPPVAQRSWCANGDFVTVAAAWLVTSEGRAMIGPVSNVQSTRKTIHRNSMFGTPYQELCNRCAKHGDTDQQRKCKANLLIKKPAPGGTRVGEGELRPASRGRLTGPGDLCLWPIGPEGGNRHAPGGIGACAGCKGESSCNSLGGGVRGIASADMAPEQLRHKPELLCSSPNALQVQSKVGYGE